MVIMNHLSVEDSDDGSPLLPEAAEAATPTPVFHRQRAATKTDSREFFLSRYGSALQGPHLFSGAAPSGFILVLTVECLRFAEKNAVCAH